MRPLLTLLAVGLAAQVHAAERKNVLLIVADDLGLQLGCYGDRAAKTPNIDALAAAGTRFTRAFASVASCSPSRATLLTGLPTHQCGQYGLAHGTHNQHTFRSVKGLPALLKPAGYRSGVVGKLHVQPKEVYPFDAEIADAGRNPVSVTAKAEQFIKSAGDAPFFLLVGFTDPHRAAKGFANEAKYPASVPRTAFDPAALPLPAFLPDQPDARADWADYYQSIARLDHGVGLLLKMLAELKHADDTLVIFLSDNGPPFPGAKTTLYDPGVHLPLIVRRPGPQAGRTCAALVSWTDIAPTVLDWAGVSKPAACAGRSLLPILADASPGGWDVVYGSHQFHEVTMYYPVRMVRTRTHKYLLNLAHGLEYPHASDLWGSPTWQGVLKRHDRLLGKRPVANFQRRPKEELYDLTADPDEVTNLAGMPAAEPVLAALRAKLASWRKATDDPWLVKDAHE
ncbi:MAG: sulfatase [Gemmataceae bacterium]